MFFLMAFNFVAFAEDDDVCSGIISGQTSPMIAGYPPDEGIIDFDCHEQSGGIYTGHMCDMSIIPGLGDAYTPNREYAACIEKNGAERDSIDASEFSVKGLAWDNNLGYITFNCGQDGKDLIGQDCVDFSGFSEEEEAEWEGYSVKIGPVDPASGPNKLRHITGVAWNSVYGYIYFDSPPGSPIQWGVVAQEKDPDKHEWEIVAMGGGEVSPYAYTNAGTWINFQGIKFILPGETVECLEGCCPKDNPDCCIDDPDACKEEELTCNPPQYYVENAKGTKKPRCEGMGGVVLPGEGLDPLGFWCSCLVPPLYCDSEKGLCLKVEVDAELGYYPIADGDQGYKIYLLARDEEGPFDAADAPRITKVGFNNWTDHVKADQISNGDSVDFNDEENPINNAGGIKVKPINPTVEGSDYDNKETVKDKEFGRFFLGNLQSYAPTTAGNTSLTEEETAYGQGYIQWENEYFVSGSEPPDFVEDKEENELILGPVDVTIDDRAPEAVKPSASGQMSLNFRPAVTFDKLNQGGKDSIMGIKDIAMKFFVKLFNDGSYDDNALTLDVIFPSRSPEDLASCSPEYIEVSEESPLGGTPYTYASDSKTGSKFSVDNINDLQGDGVDFEATPRFSDKGDQNCTFNNKSSLYTTVQYSPVADKIIKYYSNHLPRTAVSVIVPSINILGNVRAQKASVTSKDVLKISAVGGQVVFKPEKGSMLSNISSYGNISPTGGTSNDTCLIQTSNVDSKLNVSKCSEETHYTKTTSNDGETIFYFKNVDVEFDLSPISDCNSSNYSGKYIFIIKEGNVYVNEDIYNPNVGKDNQISISVLSDDPKDSKKGNMYMSCLVKNTQFTAYLDNALFQLFTGVDYDADYGEPSNLDAYFSYLVDPSKCSQWKHEGAFISYNTIGGSDNRIGRGYRAEDNAARARLYDLNYQRLIFATFKQDSNGKIIDMSCGKSFEFEDYKKADKDVPVCVDTCNSTMYVCNNGDCVSGYECDGINGTKLFDKISSPDGDIYAPPAGEGKASCGLENEYGPGYIFQAPNYSSLLKGMTVRR